MLSLALCGLVALPLLFRICAWASSRSAAYRVSSEWLNENAYSREGDKL